MTDEALAITVGRVLADEDGAVTRRCRQMPESSEGGLTRREMEIRDWGMTFGVAFGVQLGRDPEVDFDTAADNALDAARAAYLRWAGRIAPRPSLSPLVDKVIVAFEGAQRDLDRLEPVTLEVRELREAARDLLDALGTPAPERWE
jgi:hypothetical protein